jgi:mannitol-specific phosphotransferase system IIBC component
VLPAAFAVSTLVSFFVGFPRDQKKIRQKKENFREGDESDGKFRKILFRLRTRGMGSSAMGASIMRRQLEESGVFDSRGPNTSILPRAG